MKLSKICQVHFLVVNSKMYTFEKNNLKIKSIMTQYLHHVSLSSPCKMVTTLVSVTLVASLVFLIFLITHYPLGFTTVFSTLIALCLCLAVVYVRSLQPLAVEVTDDAVVIHRVIGRVEIPKQDIQQVRRKEKINRDKRVFGSGGFFGYLGYFSSVEEGGYFAYVQDAKAMVYIHTVKQNYVLSCSDPDNLVEELGN